MCVQAHYEIHGVLGARLYHLLSKKRGDGCVSFEDFVEAKVRMLGYLSFDDSLGQLDLQRLDSPECFREIGFVQMRLFGYSEQLQQDYSACLRHCFTVMGVCMCRINLKTSQ